MLKIAGFVAFCLLIVLVKGATINVQVGPDGDRVFQPANTTIRINDTVTYPTLNLHYISIDLRRWTWESDNHNVVSGFPCTPDGIFTSGTYLNITGTVWSYTFNELGVFPYFCRPHCGGGMIGNINVTETGPTTSGGASTSTTATSPAVAVIPAAICIVSAILTTLLL